MDLDDTLYLTTEAWRDLLKAAAGLEAALSFDRFRFNLSQYPHTLRESVTEAIRRNDASGGFYLGCHPIPAARSALCALLERGIRLNAYVTGRGCRVREASIRALKRDGFPDARVVCRPEEIPTRSMREWKLGVLRRMSSSARGLHAHIDDQSLHWSTREGLSSDGVARLYVHWFERGHLLTSQGSAELTWEDVERVIIRISAGL